MFIVLIDLRWNQFLKAKPQKRILFFIPLLIPSSTRARHKYFHLRRKSSARKLKTFPFLRRFSSPDLRLMTYLIFSFCSSARSMHLPQRTPLNAWSHSRSTDGIPRHPRRSQRCKSTKSISTLAARWCWTPWSRSRTKWIQLWPSVARAVRVSAAPAPWTLVEPTLWRALARLMPLLWTSQSRSTHCPTCTSSRISFPTWTTFTTSTPRFSLGCSASMIYSHLCDFQFFSWIHLSVETKKPRRRATHSTYNPLTTALSLMDSTNASCALAARLPAHLTGGTETSISAQLFSCKPTDGSSILVTSRPRLDWILFAIHSACTVAIQSWTAHAHAPKGWTREKLSLRSRSFWEELHQRTLQAWTQLLFTSKLFQAKRPQNDF